MTRLNSFNVVNNLVHTIQGHKDKESVPYNIELIFN